jgi:hypothetical protein
MVRTDVDGVVCSYASQNTWEFNGITVSSEFCSGNLAEAEAVDDDCKEIQMSTCADCQGTPHQTNYRTW